MLSVVLWVLFDGSGGNESDNGDDGGVGDSGPDGDGDDCKGLVAMVMRQRLAGGG